jgi:hypothetical protein
MSKLLSVEYEAGREVRVHLDEDGARELLGILERLMRKATKDHTHLQTEAWGGSELTEVASSGSEKINMLTIHFWPDGKEQFEDTGGRS